MMMVHRQAVRHEDTWRRSDDDGTRAGRQPGGDMRIPGGDQMMIGSQTQGTRAGSRT